MKSHTPKIAHFASSLQGGANIAGKRLHNAMVRMGVDSTFYHGEGQAADPTYIPFNRQSNFLTRNQAAIKTSLWARRWSNNGFVVGNKWIRKTPAPKFESPNTVVCLHWVSRWLDLPSFFQSLPSDTPIVWTLHDLIPITGGCANPYDCTNFRDHCGFCPQLKRPKRHDMSRSFQDEKMALYRGRNIHLVANSSWTAQKAEKSALGKLARSITQIHYGLDLDQYRVIDKATARISLSLPATGKAVIGFACLDFNDERKGARKLLRALGNLPDEIQSKILLLILGGGAWPKSEGKFEIVSLGAMSDPRIQSIFYSSLDFFVLASSSETFGNVVIEAMACKTPVVAFDCGGPRDILKDGVTGWLAAETQGESQLGERIRWMIDHPIEALRMGEEARRDVELRFADRLMAGNYMQLFESILHSSSDK